MNPRLSKQHRTPRLRVFTAVFLSFLLLEGLKTDGNIEAIKGNKLEREDPPPEEDPGSPGILEGETLMNFEEQIQQVSLLKNFYSPYRFMKKFTRTTIKRHDYLIYVTNRFGNEGNPNTINGSLILWALGRFGNLNILSLSKFLQDFESKKLLLYSLKEFKKLLLLSCL